MTVNDFIGNKVWYYEYGQMIMNELAKQGDNILCDVRSWGAIQNLVEPEDALKFHDELGQWIAEAINEKLERENSDESC